MGAEAVSVTCTVPHPFGGIDLVAGNGQKVDLVHSLTSVFPTLRGIAVEQYTPSLTDGCDFRNRLKGSNLVVMHH